MSEINFYEPISFPTLILATTSRHLSLATSGPMETLSPLSLGPLCSGSPCTSTSTTNPSTKVTNLDLMFHCILCTPIFCQKLSHINEYFLCILCNLWNFKFFCAKFFSFGPHQSPPPPSPAPRLSLAHLLHPSPSTDCPGLWEPPRPRSSRSKTPLKLTGSDIVDSTTRHLSNLSKY